MLVQADRLLYVIFGLRALGSRTRQPGLESDASILTHGLNSASNLRSSQNLSKGVRASETCGEALTVVCYLWVFERVDMGGIGAGGTLQASTARTDGVGKLLLLPQQHSTHHYQESTAQKEQQSRCKPPVFLESVRLLR